MSDFDAIDRQIIVATQAGLPLVARPYDAVAEQLSLTPTEVMRRMEALKQSGIMRRIGVVPNHYALGYKANGMAVWDVADERISELGQMIGDLDFVSHCYRRPRHLPDWPYNFFTMVHAHERPVVEQRVSEIAEMLGDALQQHKILYSTRILKKTGLRIKGT